MPLLNPLVDGEFYIDNDNGDFYLREGGAWSRRGRLVRADIVGLYAEGPFLGGAQFELAPTGYDIHYSQSLSANKSSVIVDFPAISTFDLVFTDNLAAYLAYGDRAICSAHFSGSHVASLTFTDAIVRANSPTWIVLQAAADPSFSGLRALIGGEPV